MNLHLLHLLLWQAVLLWQAGSLPLAPPGKTKSGTQRFLSTTALHHSLKKKDSKKHHGSFLSKKKYVCFILLKRKLRLKYVKKLSSKLHCYEIYVRLFFKIYFLKFSLFKRKPIILSTTRLNMGRAEKEDKTNCIHYKVLSMQKT